MSHAPTTKTCKSCRFYNAPTSECRRNPPQVGIVMGMQPGTVATGGRPVPAPIPVAAFPNIGEPDKYWCGQHEFHATPLVKA